MPCRKQYAALPFIRKKNGIEVCLITSRETGRWVLPKGWPIDGLKPHETAEQEAYEEAGLKGNVSKKTVGNFHYIKRFDDLTSVKCNVQVFPMLVEGQANDWPEQDQRKATWVKPKEAAKLVDEKELAALLRDFRPNKSTP